MRRSGRAPGLSGPVVHSWGPFLTLMLASLLTEPSLALKNSPVRNRKLWGLPVHTGLVVHSGRPSLSRVVFPRLRPAGRRSGSSLSRRRDTSRDARGVPHSATEAVAGLLKPLSPPTQWHPGVSPPLPVRKGECCLTGSGAMPQDLLIKNAPAWCWFLLTPVRKLRSCAFLWL